MSLYTAVTILLCLSFTSGLTIPFNTTTEIPTSSASTTTTTTSTTTTTPVPTTTPDLTTTTTPELNTTTTPVPNTTTAAVPDITTTAVQNTTTTPVPNTTTASVSTTTPVPNTTTASVPTTTPVLNTTTTQVQETRKATDSPNVVIEESNRKCSREGMTTDVLEVACWGYKRCVNETVVTYSCIDNTVLERDTLVCVRPGEGNTACKKEISCEGVEDGRYADKETGCQSYYQCLYGKPQPHMYCPSTLVFNEQIQNCDWAYNVEPPCGTKAVPR